MSTFLTGSYLTLDEFKAAPTALALNALVPGGDQDDQDNELAGLIGRASRQLDSWARQPLYATQTVGQRQQVRIVDGQLVLRGFQDRVVSVDAVSWGPTPRLVSNTLTAPIGAWVEEQRVLVPLSNGSVSWVGSLNAIASPTSDTPVYVDWTYTAGWPTTVLTVQAVAAATAVTVADPTGIIAGQLLTLANGADLSNVIVDSVAGQVVTLTAPLTGTWPVGCGLSQVPNDVREATILVTSHLVKMRAAGGWVMDKTPSVEKDTAGDLGPEMLQAQKIALRYERRAP